MQSSRCASQCGSVSSNTTGYLAELEQQILSNKERKLAEAKAEAALDEKIARERQTIARWGGGGEPIRHPETGEAVTQLSQQLHQYNHQGAAHEATYEVPSGDIVNNSHPPKATRAAHSRSASPTRPPEGGAAVSRSHSISEQNLRERNYVLEREVARLRSQLKLVTEAFQLELEKGEAQVPASA